MTTTTADKRQAALQALAQRELARRRLLYFTKWTHPAYDPGWVHYDICARLERFSQAVAERRSPRLMLLVPPRHGKQLADSTPVLTPRGWTTHGELRPGDWVFSPSGEPIEVLAVSGKTPSEWLVRMTDGAEVRCHGAHQWTVYDRSRREWRTVSTQYLADQKLWSGRARFQLPPVAPLQMPPASLSVDPYVLGPWLGDGSKRLQRAVGVREVLHSPNGEQGHCIHVRSSNGLYLAGAQLTPTHNSELASIRFPAWHLGQYPHHEIINVGYNLDLPMKFSRKVRELVRDPSYTKLFPDAAIDPESQSVEAWNMTKGGGFTAAGVGGGITGKGAHVLIVDDPIKNQEEADSILVRDGLDEWYQSTAYTRLAPGGGVLCIECMVGATPVRMADGTERRLDAVRPGDEVATYRNSRLSSARVAAQKCSGRDFVYEITTKSGKIVRANGRHPFLAAVDGELKWIRTRSLTTAHKIVTVPDNAASGRASLAQQTAATKRPSAAGCATCTTTAKSGPTGIVPPPLLTRQLGELVTSSTVTASRWRNMSVSWLRKAASALFARKTEADLVTLGAGGAYWPSTTAMEQAECAGSCATAVTLESGILELSPLHSLRQNTYDFTLDEVVSVAPAGEELVYDLQVEGTENFIANGLASHNTWWSDDDLAGRLQQRMRMDPMADQFEIVQYPALAEAYEWRGKRSLRLYRTPTPEPPPEAEEELEALRAPGDALHEARYPAEALHRIKANLHPRVWSALYQQNPVPDEGMYFQQGYFRFVRAVPDMRGCRIFTAWDFAIGEKQVNDFTVGATLMQDQTDTLYVLDVHRMKGDSFAIVEAIVDTAERWGLVKEADYMLGFEDGQIFRAIEPLLKRRMAERGQIRSFEVMKPLTDKLARARVLQGRMQHGRVYFPETARWLQATMSEMLRFPAGVHDDVVDALAWAARLVGDRAPPGPPEAPRLPSWKDQLDRLQLGGSHMAA